MKERRKEKREGGEIIADLKKKNWKAGQLPHLTDKKKIRCTEGKWPSSLPFETEALAPLWTVALSFRLHRTSSCLQIVTTMCFFMAQCL